MKKKVIKTLAKSDFIPLGSTAAGSAEDAEIYKKSSVLIVFLVQNTNTNKNTNDIK